MKRRAFVIMPFGKKSPAGFCGKHSAREINFECVWDSFIRPALEKAGCSAVRADSTAVAGDIRTDMFFEILAADLVVADLTVSNPNVFYELGVRHGLRSSGVLVINGRLEQSQPFDVAPDRSFSYDASLFLHSECPKKLDKQIEEMSKIFRQAILLDPITVGSPVYSHLPGLREPNWEGVKTSRTIYFRSLRDDWLACVKTAQRLGRPGDILTLADDAPSFLHRNKILYEAGIALMYLCRYSGAERIFRQILQDDPSQARAEIKLSEVLARQGRNDAAEQQLRHFLNEHADEPEASDLLGVVYRQLWHLSWRNERSSNLRRDKALEVVQLADSAIERFLFAHQSDPSSYYSGFNALILEKVLHSLGRRFHRDPSSPEEKIRDLIGVVSYVARNKREKAVKSGDYIEQFWSTTAISGLHLIQDRESQALEELCKACAIAGATPFQVRDYRDRLLLLQELDIKPHYVSRAMGLVDATLQEKISGCQCKRVFLWYAHSVEDQHVSRIEKKISENLKSWKVGEGDLCICNAANKADILFAEACLRTRARIRIMLLEPGQFAHQAPIWPFSDGTWERRFHNLLQPGPQKDLWFHIKQLGSPLEVLPLDNARETPSARHRNWMFNTAQMEAEPVTQDNQTNGRMAVSGTGGKLFGLILGPVQKQGESPEDPEYLARMINEFNGYQGQVSVIDVPRKH